MPPRMFARRRASVEIGSTPSTCRRTAPASPDGMDTRPAVFLPRSAASLAPGQSPSSGPKTPSRADAGQPDSPETSRTSAGAAVPPGRPSPPAIAPTPAGSIPGCRRPECLCPCRRSSTAPLPAATPPGTTASTLPPPAPGVGKNSSAGHSTPRPRSLLRPVGIGRCRVMRPHQEFVHQDQRALAALLNLARAPCSTAALAGGVS